MKNIKSRKFKNYGPIPNNEYSTTNAVKNEDTSVPVEVDPQTDAAAYKQRLFKRRNKHPSGQRKIGGWLRFWKANGWRAESAAQNDEANDMRRDSNDV